VPAFPFTAALGVTRRADAMSLVAFEGGQYSVPHQLAGQVVHVRRHGNQVVIAQAGPQGPAEVARHLLTSPGSPRLDKAHYPPAPPGALNREPKPRAEAADRGRGGVPRHRRRRRALAEADAAGASRVRSKMTRAVQLAALHGTEPVDRALGQAAAADRFADGDLPALLAHQATAAPGEASRAGESRTLAQGTGGWAARDGRQEEGR
jgi:hypothetical protein